MARRRRGEGEIHRSADAREGRVAAEIERAHDRIAARVDVAKLAEQIKRGNVEAALRMFPASMFKQQYARVAEQLKDAALAGGEFGQSEVDRVVK